MKIGLIAGGSTDEAALTLVSAEHITTAAKMLGHSTTIIKLSGSREGDDLEWINAVRRCDIAFPLVSGLEGLLHTLRIPYIGSDPTAAGMGADKGLFNDLLRAWGYGKTPYVRLGPWDPLSKVHDAQMKYPLFVKPSRLGASIGIVRVESRVDLEVAIETARQHDQHLVVEQGVAGTEIEVAAIVGEDVLISRPGLLVLPKGYLWHSIEAKQSYGRLVTSHELGDAVVSELRRTTLELARLTDVSCGIRVDYFLSSAGILLVGEINCLPGHGANSNFPYLFEHSGVDRSAQLHALINASMWNHARSMSARVRF
jgi:D-alanine-D-alanine ligase